MIKQNTYEKEYEEHNTGNSNINKTKARKKRRTITKYGTIRNGTQNKKLATNHVNSATPQTGHRYINLRS